MVGGLLCEVDSYMPAMYLKLFKPVMVYNLKAPETMLLKCVYFSVKFDSGSQITVIKNLADLNFGKFWQFGTYYICG